jgi:hypothetical protein
MIQQTNNLTKVGTGERFLQEKLQTAGRDIEIEYSHQQMLRAWPPDVLDPCCCCRQKGHLVAQLRMEAVTVAFEFLLTNMKDRFVSALPKSGSSTRQTPSGRRRARRKAKNSLPNGSAPETLDSAGLLPPEGWVE